MKCFKNSILLSGPNRTSECPSYLFSLVIAFTKYASVDNMSNRIQMRKNLFSNFEKVQRNCKFTIAHCLFTFFGGKKEGHYITWPFISKRHDRSYISILYLCEQPLFTFVTSSNQTLMTSAMIKEQEILKELGLTTNVRLMVYERTKVV